MSGASRAIGAAASDLIALAQRFDADPEGVRMLLESTTDDERLSMLLAGVSLLSMSPADDLRVLALAARHYAQLDDSPSGVGE